MGKSRKKLEIKSRHIYKAELEECPHCGERLQPRLHYQWRKVVQQMGGAVYVASRAKECVNTECAHQGQSYSSAAGQMVTVPECSYGLDVIAQIGWYRDREQLNRGQIHTRLKEYELQISERQVDNLYARYQVLMGCSQRLNRGRLEAVAAERGGLIISLDGLEPEGASEQLWMVREVQTGLTLVVGWLGRVNHKTLAALLEPVVELGLPIVATLSDKQGSVAKAVRTVWPDVPHQWCQSHYLGQVMRPLYEHDLQLKTELRQTIRQEIRTSLGEVLSGSEEADFSPSPGNRFSLG